jgi:hypothetical protein
LTVTVPPKVLVPVALLSLKVPETEVALVEVTEKTEVLVLKVVEALMVNVPAMATVPVADAVMVPVVTVTSPLNLKGLAPAMLIVAPRLVVPFTTKSAALLLVIVPLNSVLELEVKLPEETVTAPLKVSGRVVVLNTTLPATVTVPPKL